MSRLLMDEKPLMVLPSLAKKIGLNEAIVIQQIHFWLQTSPNMRDGVKWVYNTYPGWAEQFIWWSESTIRRTITKLEKDGLIVSTDIYNKLKIDNTKWYTINYQKLDELTSDEYDRPSAQVEQVDWSKWADTSAQIEQTITIDNTKTNIIDKYIYTIFEHWNNTNIIKHKKINAKMKSHINARLEDYELSDLIKSIDNYAEVLNNSVYYWTHRWTLEDFMKPNNVIRFLDNSKPFETFNNKFGKRGQSNGKNNTTIPLDEEYANLGF